MTPLTALRHLLDEYERGVPWTHEQWLRFLRLAHELYAAQEWQGVGGDKSVATVAKDESGW
jgi:hypothetical protein